MKTRTAPLLRAEPIDTYWPGDAAIDLGASDVAGWCRTADASLLVPRQGERPSKVTFRGLTEREMSQIPEAELEGRSFAARCYEACRYGLVSIEGEALLRHRRSGVSGLTDATLDGLCRFVETLPFDLLLSAYYGALGVELPELQRQDVEVSLPIWVGAHVLAATFRARASRS
jgi:hypothetical protein